MDSRDSSSVDAVREGDDDDVVLLTAKLAKDASILYQSKRFEDCIGVLNRCLLRKQDDPKILHNIAVAEFFQDGCSDPKELIETLFKVKKMSEDRARARASSEQTDPMTQATSKSIPGAEGNGFPNNATTGFADEFDASLATLNIATILFHLHEYPKALSSLEPLFQNMQPIDETTALHVCLLLLDVAFVVQDASKFADVINYLEKMIEVSNKSNQAVTGTTRHQQASNFVMKPVSIPNNSSTSDDVKSEGIATGSASEGSLSRTLSDEAREYETWLSTLDISRQNTSRTFELFSPRNLSMTPSDRSTLSNLKLQFPLYKIQLLILTRNLKAAKREVKMAMNVVRGIDSSSRTLLLKSQLEYASGNYPKALKLVKASSNQGDVGSSIVTNNNFGCIYHSQGKHNTSGIFFLKALSICSSLLKEKPRKLASFSQDKSLLVSYNCGLHYLACGKPFLAAQLFQRASSVLYKRPLLWLRLAECCLMANETSVHESEFRVQVIGQGKWRYLAAETGSRRDGNENSDEMEDDSVLQKLSLPFARQCLGNALHLLGSESKHVKAGLSKRSSPEDNDSSDPKSKDLVNSGQVSGNGDAKEHSKGGPHANSAAANTLSEYEEMCRRENEKIKQAILIDLAFVELELENPLKALTSVLSLLNLPECSRMHTFLGHVYAAEALCLLNRPKEAAEHLSTYVSHEGTVESPYTEKDCRQWKTKKTVDAEDMNTHQATTRIPASEELQDNVFLSPEEARGALYVNLASMYAMQGNFEQASKYTSQALAMTPNNQKASLMAVYLNLKLGKKQEALEKLKRLYRIRFLPFSSRSKGSL